MIPFVKKWQMRGVEKNIINELNKPYSRLSDSGYKLKQSLLFCNTERKETKIVLPVSFSPGEGKTLVSIISGLAFVRGGEKVLLVDANLRNRQLSKTFNAGDKKGLSDSLIEKCDLSALILPVGENGLYLLPAGTLRINIELLESEAFRGELRRLKETFDRIIIDISSISSGPESFMLSGISDLIFMMISFGKTRVKDALEAQKLLEANEGKVIGGCLNFVPGVRPTDQFFWVLTKSDLSGLIRNIGSKIRDILKKD
jgi:Mrp family chromosome partitioning ATPase